MWSVACWFAAAMLGAASVLGSSIPKGVWWVAALVVCAAAMVLGVLAVVFRMSEPRTMKVITRVEHHVPDNAVIY
jgi:ABC-type antimicrobial peptide transport system permease subunit